MNRDYYIIDFDSTFISVEALDELASIALRKNREKEEILNRFREILNSRNIILKKIKEGSSATNHLDVWNRLLADKAYTIITKRNELKFRRNIE